MSKGLNEIISDVAKEYFKMPEATFDGDIILAKKEIIKIAETYNKELLEQVSQKDFELKAADSDYKKIGDNDQWNSSPVPEDVTMVIRWHKPTNSPVIVYYSESFDKRMPWVQSTKSHCWPEESFEPNLWRFSPKLLF